jgi:hypothetical protein
MGDRFVLVGAITIIMGETGTGISTGTGTGTPAGGTAGVGATIGIGSPMGGSVSIAHLAPGDSVAMNGAAHITHQHPWVGRASRMPAKD